MGNTIRYTLTMLIVAIILASCFSLVGDPSTTFIKSSNNFNNTKKAVLLLSTGNATVDFSLQVSIYNYDYKLSGKELGNTFTVDRNHSETGLDSSSINFHWLGNDTLQIDYDKKLRTFIQGTKVNKVTVLYQPR